MLVRPNILAKRLELATKLARRNGGKLPNPWKMMQQGHEGLYRYIYRHPDEFSHFEVEEAVRGQSKRNSRVTFNVVIKEEHLKTAHQLSRKNGGVLQDYLWLKNNGHKRLADYVRHHPSFFGLTYTPKRKAKLKAKKSGTHKKKVRRLWV